MNGILFDSDHGSEKLGIGQVRLGEFLKRDDVHVDPDEDVARRRVLRRGGVADALFDVPRRDLDGVTAAT